MDLAYSAKRDLQTILGLEFCERRERNGLYVADRDVRVRLQKLGEVRQSTTASCSERVRGESLISGHGSVWPATREHKRGVGQTKFGDVRDLRHGMIDGALALPAKIEAKLQLVEVLFQAARDTLKKIILWTFSVT